LDFLLEEEDFETETSVIRKLHGQVRRLLLFS